MAKQPGRKTTKKARSKAAANAAAPAPRSPGKHSNRVITIRALDPQNKEIFEASLLSTAKLEQLAEKWTYILRARSRWAHDIEQRKYFGSQAVEDLKDLGVKLEFIERLSTVIHIEVELHPWDTQDAEAARIGETASEIPWGISDQRRHTLGGTLSTAAHHKALSQWQTAGSTTSARACALCRKRTGPA